MADDTQPQPAPKPSLVIPMPRVDAGLVVNAFTVAFAVLICVAIGLLTDYRWGLLAGGLLGFTSAVYVSRNMPDTAPKHATVTPLKKAS